MKKNKFLTLLFLPFLLNSCSSQSGFYDNYENQILDASDNYRTFYEIFPSSYYDSNNDGNGDLNGITEKLDYIKTMGFDGIWLTPIHESPTYHGYDVTDYYSINPKLGTIEDYKNLLNECHERGIKVILDLVINHTALNNEWFIKGVEAFKNGSDSKYKNYYNFSLTQDTSHNYYYNGVYYEAGFGSTMPDLNLDSEDVKSEIKDIIKYYIFDLGVDGFRLDAVPWYFKGDEAKNIEFLSWLNNVTKSYNENAYIVAEAWESAGTITRYYESGVDSFFAYNSNPLGNDIISYIIRNNGENYTEKMSYLIEQAGNHIPAPFITNHDNPRAANILQGTKKDDYLKFGQGLMQMMTGSTFTYYGDEIGMIAANPPDENVRTAMLWGEEEGECDNPANTSELKNTYGTVKDQMDNENSILYYYRNANRIRNKYPSIRKGTVEVVDNSNKEIVFIKKTFEEDACYIIINFGDIKNTIDLSELNLDKINYEALLVDNNEQIKLSNQQLTLPHHAIVVVDC